MLLFLDFLPEFLNNQISFDTEDTFVNSFTTKLINYQHKFGALRKLAIPWYELLESSAGKQPDKIPANNYSCKTFYSYVC